MLKWLISDKYVEIFFLMTITEHFKSKQVYFNNVQFAGHQVAQICGLVNGYHLTFATYII